MWASDYAFPSPKLIVGMKTVGLSVAMITAFPALRRGVTGKTGIAFVAGNYAYLSGSLGYNPVRNDIANILHFLHQSWLASLTCSQCQRVEWTSKKVVVPKNGFMLN